jgi:hypothetical protein
VVEIALAVAGGHALAAVQSNWASGLLKTLNAYTCPMHRWMHSAAGGTNQRLKPGPAME